MGTLKQFEDIESWRKARELANAIYRVTRQGAFAKDYTLRDQIIRATISVMANIAEGFEREGNRKFINFLTTAKASLAEVKSHLYLALDQNYLAPAQFAQLSDLIQDIARLIGGFVRYLQQSPIPGRKFRVESASTNSKLQTPNSKL
jgi:four helix bundle protein